MNRRLYKTERYLLLVNVSSVISSLYDLRGTEVQFQVGSMESFKPQSCK